MKNLKKYIAFSFLSLVTISCEQEFKTFTNDPCEGNAPGIICHPDAIVECPSGASAGSADFTKFVAIGSSFTAGFQAGALFNDGQNASIPALMAGKFACVGGAATFNQPSIGTANGFNIFVTPNPVGGTTVLGRFRLQGTPPGPLPVISEVSAIPNPQVNPAFIYTGSKVDLNNFAVQAVQLGQALIPQTGDWTLAGADPRFSPFYARIASNPGTSTMVTDMVTSLMNGGTFFMFWLGMDDFLLNAVFGGDNSLAPLTPVEFESAQNPGFKYLFNAAMDGILMNPTLEGVVVNYPNIFTMPHFRLVAYNPIPMDAPTATLVNNNYAGYNQILDALKGPPFSYNAAEMDARKISFAAGANPFVIIDETLNDLGDEFDGLLAAQAITQAQRTSLIPYEQVRMTTATDIIPLSAGSVLGELADPGNPLSIQGVAVPLGDRYAIIPSESAAIMNRITEFNAHIKAYADEHSDRLAHADVHKALSDFVTAQFYVVNGVTITPNINPPTGIYSEDGLHPNSRGYAFLSGAIIEAINAKFGATVPIPFVGNYGATGLPINP